MILNKYRSSKAYFKRNMNKYNENGAMGGIAVP